MEPDPYMTDDPLLFSLFTRTSQENQPQAHILTQAAQQQQTQSQHQQHQPLLPPPSVPPAPSQNQPQQQPQHQQQLSSASPSGSVAQSVAQVDTCTSIGSTGEEASQLTSQICYTARTDSLQEATKSSQHQHQHQHTTHSQHPPAGPNLSHHLTSQPHPHPHPHPHPPTQQPSSYHQAGSSSQFTVNEAIANLYPFQYPSPHQERPFEPPTQRASHLALVAASYQGHQSHSSPFIPHPPDPSDPASSTRQQQQNMYLISPDQVTDPLDTAVASIEQQLAASSTDETTEETGPPCPSGPSSFTRQDNLMDCTSATGSRQGSLLELAPKQQNDERFDQGHYEYLQKSTSQSNAQISSGVLHHNVKQHGMQDDDDDEEIQELSGELDQKRLNHSEIEKRRREKMNAYIKELAAIIPLCSGMSRKLDKLTVLRMAVQHMKSIRGSMSPLTPGSQIKPSFLSTKKIHELILKVAEGFLFVVSCDRGKILSITDSVSQVLGYSSSDLIGQNWFDILHPKDVTKVKEELTSFDLLTKKERLVDAKTMLPVTEFHKRGPSEITSHSHPTGSTSNTGLAAFLPGARRAFFCRMKCKSSTKGGKCDEATGDLTSGIKKKKSSSEKKYVVIHCIGYIKSWPRESIQTADHTSDDQKSFVKSQTASTSGSSSTAASSSLASSSPASCGKDAEEDEMGCDLSCLVAVARTLPPFTPPSVTNSSVHSISTESNPLAPSTTSTLADFVDYVSRHSMDGKFVFVDHRVVYVLGHLPQDLLNTSIYEYCHPDDVKILAESHRRALSMSGHATSLELLKHQTASRAYRLRTKSGSYITLQTYWQLFKNPWTKEFEYLIARNVCVPDSKHESYNPSVPLCGKSDKDKMEATSKEANLAVNSFYLDKFLQKINQSPTGPPSSTEKDSSGGSSSETRVKRILSSSRVNLWKIGQQIAEEADQRRRGQETDSISTRSTGSSCVSSPSPLDVSTVKTTSAGSASSPGSTYSCPMSSSQSFNSLTGSAGSKGTMSVASGASVAGSSSLRPVGYLNDPIVPSADENVARHHQNMTESSETPAVPPEQPETGPQDIDEAAMALVMSLLEADAGLGGPVDFSSFPWPL